MSTDPERRKIAFFGNFGTGNLGNEATLQAMVYNLRKYVPKAEIACICSNPENTALTHNISVFPTRAAFSIRKMLSAWRKNKPGMGNSGANTSESPRADRQFRGLSRLKAPLLETYRWFKGLKTLWGTDALVVPGTGLLTDAYTLSDWGPYDMFRWSVTAKLCRCKLFFVSVGAGPIYSRAGRCLAKAALSLADFRSYRDESTLQYLKSIGFRADNDPVYPDLAFSLPESSIPRGHDRARRRVVVGLGLMGYAGRYSVERPTSTVYSGYLETLVEFVTWLLAHEYDVRLLIGDLAYDTSVTREFRLLLKERSVRHEEERIIDQPVASVEDLLSQVAATDLVVATRFHNVLLSLLLQKPVLAISFHHKCSSLMRQMGLSEYCQDINHLNSGRLIEQFCQLQQSAACVKRMIGEKVNTHRTALEKQYGIILSAIRTGRQQVL